MRPQLCLIMPIGDVNAPPGWDTFPKPQPPSGNRPDNELPGGPIALPPLVPGMPLPPGIEGSPDHPWLPGMGRPNRPGNELPGGPPDHAWWGGGRPDRPSNELPNAPVYPSHPIYITDSPDKPIQAPPGTIWPPLPPEVDKKMIALVWIPGVGHKWIVIDPNLKPPNAPTGPARPKA